MTRATSLGLLRMFRHFDILLPQSPLHRSSNPLHTSDNPAKAASQSGREVDYQQLQRPRQRRVSSTWQDGFEVLAIRFRLRCYRADLATNAHCSLAAVLLYIMEGFGPPCGYLSFRTELRHRFPRFHNLNDYQITNHALE
jgi:hypothetical protein